MIQLLQHFDHLVSPLAHALAKFSTQFNCKNVTTEVVRYISLLSPPPHPHTHSSLPISHLFSLSLAISHHCNLPPATRELGSKDPRDLAIDSSGTRSFAAFLVELSHLTPDCVLLCVSVLLPHLNGESYTFRNGVLGVMAELLLHLHQNPLDEQGRQLRDSLFVKLEEHVHDTNAFVRVKVLQLLMQLVTAQVK